MPFVLILEDGTGLPNSNSYASVAEADAYHDAHLHAETWTGATAERKATALGMATRVLDSLMEWNGRKSKPDTQALQWPRVALVSGRYSTGFWGVGVLDPQVVPKPVKDATAELARKLLESDRTADPETQGLKRLGLGQNAIALEFDSQDRPDVVPDLVVDLVSEYGHRKGKASWRKTTRA